MLGEGFDHPKLSVAAIFRPFRSLGPYLQFVGRIMRVVVQNSPGHPDNLGHIVTHLGMNLDARFQEFK
ncbi:DEAD/DEAH box helicase, partial [Amaricoccus sp. HAR-UPW-R2A-40]